MSSPSTKPNPNDNISFDPSTAIPSSSRMTSTMTMTYDPEHRFSQIEMRMEKYDQLLAEIQRSQDRHDLMLQTFIEEMKELKLHDIDLSKIAQGHDINLMQNNHRWTIFGNITKWVLGVALSIFLLFMGTLITHLFSIWP